MICSSSADAETGDTPVCYGKFMASNKMAVPAGFCYRSKEARDFNVKFLCYVNNATTVYITFTVELFSTINYQRTCDPTSPVLDWPQVVTFSSECAAIMHGPVIKDSCMCPV